MGFTVRADQPRENSHTLTFALVSSEIRSVFGSFNARRREAWTLSKMASVSGIFFRDASSERV